MATVFFPSLDDAAVVAVEFVPLQGTPRLLKLLVDTGFTGKSSVILGRAAADLTQAALPSAETKGALQGTQDRAWVTCRIAGLNFQSTLIAIITDLAGLSLATGVEGIVG